jgi:hypothetical protein
MTMENLDQTGIENLRGALRYTADDARRRAEAVARLADEIDEGQTRDARDAAITARLLNQQWEDRRRPVNDEAGQLAAVIVGHQPPPPAQGPPPGAPVAGAGAPPPVAGPPAAPVIVVPAQPDPLNPWNWDGWQWLFAIGAAFIGLAVGIGTYRPLLHLAGAYRKVGTGKNRHTVVAHWAPVFGIPWVIAMVAAFFFLGALLGIPLGRAINRNRAAA